MIVASKGRDASRASRGLGFTPLSLMSLCVASLLLQMISSIRFCLQQDDLAYCASRVGVGSTTSIAYHLAGDRILRLELLGAEHC